MVGWCAGKPIHTYSTERIRRRSIATKNCSKYANLDNSKLAEILADLDMVRVKGLEPPLPYGKQIPSLPRLPFRHTRINNLAVYCDP